EALSMSDTIVVMKDGEIQQIGTPQDIYNEPKNAFVADFIGESNIFDGIFVKDFVVSFCGKTFPCVDKGFTSNLPIDVVIRPEDLLITTKEQGMVVGTVTSVVFKGVHYEMNINCDGLDWVVHSTKCKNVGEEVGLSFTDEDIHIMNKLFKGNTNKVSATVIDEDTIEFLGVSFVRKSHGFTNNVMLTISPKIITVVSQDLADITVYLESLIYKGAFNELIVFVYSANMELMVHSQSDEQLATDIGIKFDFDKIEIEQLNNDEEV
ncbi:MAG: TOBE domain-containing protein, partial [Oscillospiraceae bacterium]